MEYFDKKEDVLDIELTPFGELQLFKGTFKPEYYAFFDDEILYDSNYANFDEKQKDVKKRIKEVPRLKTQVQFRGGEFPKYITQKIVEQLETTPGTVEQFVPGTPAKTVEMYQYMLPHLGENLPNNISLQEKTAAITVEHTVEEAHSQGPGNPGQTLDEYYQAQTETYFAKLQKEGQKASQAGSFKRIKFTKQVPAVPSQTIPGIPGVPGGIITTHQYPHPVFAQNVLPLPLGKCSYDTSFAPAWDVAMLYGEITGSVEMLTSSLRPYLKIPQLNVDVVYESYVGPSDKTQTPDSTKHKLSNFQEIHDTRYVHEDGTSVHFDEDFVLLKITEEHVPFLKENFDIEVFKVENTDKGGKEYDRGIERDLFPLTFLKPTLTMVDENGLLMSFEEQIAQQEKELNLQMQTLSDSFVEHYFNIWVDSEIDKELLCKYAPVEKTKKGVFISDPRDCDDEGQSFSAHQVYKNYQDELIPECDD